MQTSLKGLWPEAALDRILESFERELIHASDHEIMAAANELGMNPAMQGSAAFLGLKYPAPAQFGEFLGVRTWANDLETEAGKAAFAIRMNPKSAAWDSITAARPRKAPSDK
jgi:hypothetical protein